MSEFVHLLKERMEERGFSPDDQQLAQFEIYRWELKNWNTKINLTSLTDDLDILYRHFIDSLLLLSYQSLKSGARVVDVGSGGGFPGLPIRIYRPDIRLSLLESVGKKARFLEHIVSRLELGGVEVMNHRAEIVARWPEHREQYEIAVARGVARLAALAEYCLPLVSVGGRFVAYKGHDAELEVKEAETALETLGGRFEKIARDKGFRDPATPLSDLNSNSDDGCTGRRALVFVEKVKKTPDKYPRRPGMPRKRPL